MQATTVSRDNPLPLYHQVKLVLLEKIRSDEWGVGTTIPSENELTQQLDVSRATIRQAVAELAKTGHLHRIQGKGTVVTEPKVEPIGALTSFTENMRAAGIVPTHRTLRAEWLTPPNHVAAHLAGESKLVAKHAFFIERLLIADGSPLAIQRAWLPRWIIEIEPERFSKHQLDAGSLYQTLEQRCGITLERAEETLDIALPSEQEQQLLGVSEHHSLMVIQRTTSDSQNRPVEFAELLFRADRYRYKVALRRDLYREGVISGS